MIKNKEDAIAKFVESAKMYTSLLGSEDYKISNKHFKIIAGCAGYLKINNELEDLAFLLRDDNIGVRSWAAYYILTINENLAIDTYNKIIDMKVPFISLSAEYVLKGWYDGSLDIYFGS